MIIILTHIPCYISVNQVETVREHIKWKVFGDTVQNLGAQKKRNAPTKKPFSVIYDSEISTSKSLIVQNN